MDRNKWRSTMVTAFILILATGIVCGARECKDGEVGGDYQGTVARTKTGKICQAWSSQYPHQHTKTAGTLPEGNLADAKNYCRNPLSGDHGPWCYTTSYSTRFEYCDIPLCSDSARTGADCQQSQLGKDYQGIVARTNSSKTCQAWSRQYPHKHSRKASTFPEGNFADAKNYCRNPVSGNDGPWCYTTDPETRWEYCDVPLCTTDCKETELGRDYQGTLSRTREGKTCQAWSRQFPHRHSQKASNLPEGNFADAKNYCRNPDSEPGGPWCYTTDSSARWQYCDVPLCHPPVEADCKQSQLGRDYQGTLSRTREGKTCQAWSRQYPHRHSQKASNLPEGSFADAKNYCRNPDSEPGGPWCYTTDSSARWQYCDVPLCHPPVEADCKQSQLGKDYQGTVALTNSGKTCQAWSSQYPHQHSQKASNLPEGNFADAKNYCRNPDRVIGGPWCYTTDVETRWEYCDVPLCQSSPEVDCKVSQLGREYQGTLAKTTTGKTCQAWNSQSPHRHNQKAGNLPELSFADAKNYCRNPDSETGGPWCYTTDRNSRWEYCDVPPCQPSPVAECKQSQLGRDYRGQVAKTRSGKTCQAWSRQSPHQHSQKASNLPEGNFADAQNYCRNPDDESGGPWCYTTDSSVRWEYCDVSLCRQCKQSRLGQEYQGGKATTKNGRTCQSWKSQYPQKHKFHTAEKFPDKTMEDVGNYCRNPDGVTGGPWCYTTDPDVRWEYCDVPDCTECKHTQLGREYLGRLNTTRSGRKCQTWTSQAPHSHKFKTASQFQETRMSAIVNYCRNPDSESEGPWCYTTDPKVRWEYCDVPFCQSCKHTKSAVEYKGTMAVTKSGKNCQSWSAQSPHDHGFTQSSDFPDKTMADVANHCRNPDNDSKGPWCYTTDPDTRWESCDIKYCNCKKSAIGQDYQGDVASTKNGRTCQAWTSQHPHNHTFTTHMHFPEVNLRDAANYCRNPDGVSGGPWCYTTDPEVEWEYCNVPPCSN